MPGAEITIAGNPAIRSTYDAGGHLLNLDVDIVFVDTTSTYWEVDGADDVADL